jgi:hypothetical protein
MLKLAGKEGFEPSHAGIKIRCLNQLGDFPIYLILCHFTFFLSSICYKLSVEPHHYLAKIVTYSLINNIKLFK